MKRRGESACHFLVSCEIARSDLGHASTGTATINVISNGTFSTGTGTTTIHSTGEINLNEGTFSFNGPIAGNGSFIFNSGQLNVNDPTQSVGFGTSGLRLGGLVPIISPILNGTKELNVAGNTIVDPGGSLTVQGATVLTGSLIVLGGGTVTYQSGSFDPGIILEAAGSVLDIQANISLGNASAVNGFGSAGTLHLHGNTVTLQDANDAVFDSLALVTLGEVSNPGSLAAANGITLDFGGNIIGHGTINTPNSAATPLINNGNITADDPNAPITLTDCVKGVGTLDNVLIIGTDAPGFSPATVNRGSVSYDGTLEIELGGTSPGDFDQLNHILGLGVADLGGTLDVQLINEFTPSFGDSFEFLTAASVLGVFDTTLLPALGGGLQWSLDYQPTSVSLLVGLAGDFDFDGDVDGNDFLFWQQAPSVGSLADWEANYSAVAPLSASSTAVPEPNSLALLSLGGLLALRSLRRGTPFTA